jgi:hypothetical protein
MSEPIADRLKQFTPDGSGLDRDAVLFAAGRASAPRHRGWVALTGVLAATQVLTLVLLWPRPAPSPALPEVPVVEPPAGTPGPSDWQVLRQGLLDERVPPPAPVGDLVPDEPPLRGFTAVLNDSD